MNKESAAPNVMAIVTRFNRLVSWTQWTVLRSEKAEGRVRTIHFFIKTARALREMHNYAGMYALVTGLQGVAVKRLQLTWALVKRKKSEKLQALVDFMKLDQQYVPPFLHLIRLISMELQIRSISGAPGEAAVVSTVCTIRGPVPRPADVRGGDAPPAAWLGECRAPARRALLHPSPPALPALA